MAGGCRGSPLGKFSGRSFMKKSISILSLLCLLPVVVASEQNFRYDAANRLISVSLPSSQMISYEYDAAGNILVRRFGSLGAQDEDGDGLPDDWEQEHFRSLDETGAGDFDLDGSSNLEEFLAGTDPGSNASLLRIVSVSVGGAGAVQLQIASISGKTYQVQSKDDLSDASWSERETLTASGSTVAWTDPSGGGLTRFYRVLLRP